MLLPSLLIGTITVFLVGHDDGVVEDDESDLTASANPYVIKKGDKIASIAIALHGKT